MPPTIVRNNTAIAAHLERHIEELRQMAYLLPNHLLADVREASRRLSVIRGYLLTESKYQSPTDTNAIRDYLKSEEGQNLIRLIVHPVNPNL